MIGCAVAVWLYVVGLIGLHALSRALQKRPVRSARAWRNLLLWPITVFIGFVGDVYDKILAALDGGR